MENVPSLDRSRSLGLPMVLNCCFIAGLLCAGSLSPAVACMNDYKPNVAAIERSTALIQQLREHPTKEPWTERRDRLRKLLAQGGDFRLKNDLATTLAHTGEAAEAVKLLEEVEAEKPGLYFTAANLGTAYELSGDDHKALEWIRKGIERNPEAHDGTEWLHVRILEAKLAMAEDPKWLESHSILDGGESAKTPRTITGNRGEPLSPDQVKAALIYQLHERLQFVPPPDAVVGALLLDLGELVAGEPSGVAGARAILELSRDYLKASPAESHLSNRVDHLYMRARMDEQIPDPGRGARRNGLILVLAVGPLLSFLVIRWKRRIEQHRQAAPKVEEPNVPVHETHF